MSPALSARRPLKLSSSKISSSCILQQLILVGVTDGGQPALEQTTNAIRPSIRREAVRDFVISRFKLRGYLPVSSRPAKRGHGDVRMNTVLKACCFTGLSFSLLASAASASEFALSNNQRISCSRGLSPGKLSTATCKSYAYVFNVKTSEYFRCSVSMSLTRDNKEVISNQSEGSCVKKPRIFDTDSSYSFDATETEPPNTNSFFGQGGYAVWASDNTARKVRGCIIISSGLGSDVTKCLDMKFE
jgi:hypothetical protein